MARWLTGSLLALAAGALGTGGCSNGDGETGDGSSSSGSMGDGDAPWNQPGGDGDGSSSGDGDGIRIIEVPQIPGGGANAAPLAPGCGPETAHDCTPPGSGCDNGELLAGGGVEVRDAGAVCFYGEGLDVPSATVEHITESVDGEEYVHVRVIFDPDFVDTVYGECSSETGWSEMRGHTYKDLVGSDHTELMLYNCDDELSLHVKVDFISENPDSECGYANLGVTGGDGEVLVGNADDVLAVATSLDRNVNGCGYCDDEALALGQMMGMKDKDAPQPQSPCPSGEGYAPSEEAPEWDFRMVYELWISVDAFGDSGFCRPDIESVHASPSKADSNTILVEPDDCPPPPGDNPDCPPNYELYLSSEGEYLCAGPPDDGECADGFEIDLTSEGELCIPLGAQ